MRNVMNNEDPPRMMTADLKAAAIISLILVLPLMLLEWVNHRSLHESFPVALFVVLLLLPMTFVFVLAPIVRTVRARGSLAARPVSLLFRVALLTFVALAWAGIMLDQLPCFMGVPNCD